jgi:hypothetical protein
VIFTRFSLQRLSKDHACNRRYTARRACRSEIPYAGGRPGGIEAFTIKLEEAEVRRVPAVTGVLYQRNKNVLVGLVFVPARGLIETRSGQRGRVITVHRLAG